MCVIAKIILMPIGCFLVTYMGFDIYIQNLFDEQFLYMFSNPICCVADLHLIQDNLNFMMFMSVMYKDSGIIDADDHDEDEEAQQ